VNENLVRYRMPARVAAVVGGYVAYRWSSDDRIVPGLMVGAGAILLAWSIIDEITLPKRERLGLMVVGSAILGLGLLGAGLFLTLS
jgi:hypothetical protein